VFLPHDLDSIGTGKWVAQQAAACHGKLRLLVRSHASGFA
jgi:hypothetical protein